MKLIKTNLVVAAIACIFYSSQAQSFSFEDMSAQTGFNMTGKNHGIAIADFNNDGWDDIYVSRAEAPNLLYVNQGNFEFVEAGAEFHVDYPGHTNCSVWFDLDQDKDLDLFLGNGFENNVLYRNDGSHFTDVSAEYGIDQTVGNVRSVNTVDFDNDGDLDIYVAQVLQENILWRNDGNVFTNVIAESGISLVGRSLGAIFFDYDNDGDQDLYQGQDGFDGNFLYRNNGDGTFTDQTVETRLTFAGFCMGAAVGDVNEDGFADIYIENLDSNRLYISDGLGRFDEISSAVGVADIGMGWSAFFFDYDNNGLSDIYLTNDSYFGIPGHGKVPNQLFINQGNLTFQAEDYVGNIQNEFGSYGTAYADFDLDGRLDIVVANEGPDDGNQIFRNVETSGNYIAFDLEGMISNSQAIGSRVVLYSGDLTQTGYVVGGSGYASQNSSVVHFGLGDLTSIDSVVIYWPSGLRQKSGKLKINQRYNVREGESILATGLVVWTVPAFPTKFDDVTVFFDASQGNGALEGFQGSVFAHTGVISSESANGNDWQHVIGNWGTPDPRVLMTREEENIYSLSYNITDFYNIPVPEEVYQMAFVFRNVNGSIVGRDTDGSDIFTDVYPSDLGLFLDVRSPSGTDVLIPFNQDVDIDVAASDTVNLTIYDNADLIFSEIILDTQFTYLPLNPGRHLLRFEGSRDTMLVVEEREFYVYTDAPVTSSPTNVVNGLNYFTDSTYVFQLNAPQKAYAFLLCPANGYKAHEDFQMNQTVDQTYWIELPQSVFADGKNTYQYLVSDGIRIADPHSEVVLDPGNDYWVDAEVMATLPPYPQNMTTGIVTAFDTDYQPFDFEVDDFEKPEKVKLVIYEMLLRDFLADHSFSSLLDTLNYFQKLGVNAIELMPIHEFEGNESWGYNPSFHMAVDKYYGTREQLKAFIDAAHQRGIAVILDVVFNHTFGQGPLAQMYWDPVNSRPAAGSPYLNVTPRHPFNVGYDFNHESQATKQWVKRILTYWITEFKFDGFRFDLSKGLTQFNSGNDAGLMAQYDAGRIAILKDYADHIWSLDPESYVIMEHFADNDEETVLSNYGMMLWGNINYGFSQAAKGFQSDLDWIDYTRHGWNDPHVVGYMESHDEERLMYRTLNEGDNEGDYNTRALTTALQRMEAVGAIFYSIPGPKMLWEFGELGYDYPINWCTNGTINNNCRLDPKPIRWDYLTDYRRERLRRVTSALMELKTQYPTFSTDDFTFSDGNFFVKTVHLNHPDMDAVALANFRVINSDVNPKFQYPGTWYEYFTGDSIIVTDTEERITFKPGEYRIYTSERIMPSEGFISATRDVPVYSLDLFPTLVGAGGSVFALLPTEAGAIETVTIEGISGSLTASCYFEIRDDHVGIGIQDGLPSGMYMIRVQTGDALFVGKVVKQ
ncbi:MAG TPA: FG-GAP-like repeat-containing protein [Saprospiraceae bacterium]|nr:FG-GAP-like repeat-containing protein [Saprospiraceae bacterium]